MNDRVTLQSDEQVAAEAGRAGAEPENRAGAGAGSSDIPAQAAVGPEGAGGEQKEAATHLKLRRLKIHKWRNVLPGAELHFGDGIHALLGKNGTGKTTLLKLISMCVRGNFSELRSEDFSIEYELHFSHYKVSFSITNESSELAPAHEVLANFTARDQASASLAEPNYWFRLVLSGVQNMPIHIEGTRTDLTFNKKREDSFGPGFVSPFRPDVFARLAFAMSVIPTNGDESLPRTVPSKIKMQDGVRLFVKASLLLDSMSPFRFDEASGLLHALEGSRDERYADVPPLEFTIVPLEPWLVAGSQQWVPSELQDFLERPDGKQPFPLTEITVTSSDLPILQKWVTLAGFEKVILSLSLQKKLKVGQDKDGYVFGKCKFFIQLRNGDIISHDQLSFGQRRLLAFLYYTACNPDVIVADELTNGLHHEWIEACVDELQKRQSFVATQNPLLIDYLPVNSPKDAETAFIQCRLIEKDGKQWMDWRNTTPEEAERFWKTYETGVQFINEILRTDGLW